MSKTIETHLQSNEVRIPKKSSGGTAEFDVSSTAAPCQYFKSSFARSLSFSQGNGGHHGGGDNHFTRSLDFEVNYGGLSTIPDGTGGSGGGGGGGGSSQTTPSASPVFDPDRELLNGEKTKLVNGIATANGGVVKTLWNYAKGSPSKSASPGGTPSKLASGAAVAISTASSQATAAMSGSGSSSSTRKSVEANEIEVLRLRKECQNLIEENRRLVNLAANSGYAINGLMNGNSSSGHGGGGHHHGHGHHGGSSSGSSSLTTSLGLGLAGGGVGGGGGAGAGPAATVAGMYSTVESVILQTQVETLQWQLKQVDSSRQMYRAVMEEVVRYLDRCYRSLDAIGHTSNIGRSKSVLQVSRVPSSSSSIHNHNDSDSSNASSPRARSSTNLIDVQKSASSMSSSSSSYTKKQHQLQQQQQQQQQQSQAGTAPLTNGNHSSLLLDDDSVVSPSPAGSYSTFRDFTWRRSPKRTSAQPATLPISGTEVDPEKLAQEAFRLLRTVQNLLNTQEPTLSSQSSSASSGLDSLLLLAGAASGSGAGSATGSTTTLTAGVAPVVNTRSNVGFSRKLNMRGSRLSLRSSTDDSVHSTSSSNNEDNTDRPSPPLLNHHGHHHPGGSSSSSSTTSSSSGSHLVVNHRHSANIDRIKEMMIASSAEDESGFSSMNSFQEIGLPLVNSTMLSSANGTDSNSSAASSTGSVSFVSDESSDLRDATVIPKLGIPKAAPEIPTRVTQSAAYEHHNHFVNHRRWDSALVMLPQKLKIHQQLGGGTGNGNDSDSGVSSRVLWV